MGCGVAESCSGGQNSEPAGCGSAAHVVETGVTCLFMWVPELLPSGPRSRAGHFTSPGRRYGQGNVLTSVSGEGAPGSVLRLGVGDPVCHLFWLMSPGIVFFPATADRPL